MKGTGPVEKENAEPDKIEQRYKANGLATDKRIYNSGILGFISPFLPYICQILPGKGPKVLKKEHIFFGF